MSDEPTPKHISFDFEKSPHFRTVHVDGAFGGPTPQGLLQIALYSERLPIPKTIRYELTAEGKLATELSREGRTNLFREVEVNLTMTPDVARSIRDWLSENLARLDDLVGKGERK